MSVERNFDLKGSFDDPFMSEVTKYHVTVTFFGLVR